MLDNSFYTKEELMSLGFKSVGEYVYVSKKASIYGIEKISIGNNVRIDDFCIISGKVTLGSNIHISAYCALYGGADGIFMEDYSGISARTTIYALTDDFGGEYMTGVMVDNNFRNVISGAVVLEKYVQLGANCVVLPGLTIKEGTVVGAMSLVNSTLESWGIYAGCPCRLVRPRKKDLLTFIKTDKSQD